MATKRPPSLLRTLRLIALAVALLGIGKLVSTVLFSNNAYYANGIILDFAPTDEFFSPKTTPIIAFVDFRDQKQLAAPESALGTENLFLGQKVLIRYDPNTPKILRIDTPIGLWGTGVIRILFGLVPFVILSLVISAQGKRAPARQPRMAARSQSIKPTHLIRHKGAAPVEAGVVRRMR